MKRKFKFINIKEIFFVDLTSCAMNQKFPNIEYLNYIFNFYKLKKSFKEFFMEKMKKKKVVDYLT